MLNQNGMSLVQQTIAPVERRGILERRLAPGGLGAGNFEGKVEGGGLEDGVVEANFRGGPIAAGGQKRSS